MDDDTFSGIVIVGVLIFIVMTIFLFVGIINPMMQPWWAEQDGRAELAQAEQNRQIAILEAKAKMESAELLAQAEVKRAEGVAQANKIIATSISEQYLKYLYIQGIQDNNNKIIYIPTNGLLPVLDLKEEDKE